MDYVTVSVETFRKNWGLVVAAIKGYRPLRQYESFALLHADTDRNEFTIRLANETGGIRVAMLGNDQPSTTLVQNGMEIAVKIEDISRMLPYLGKGSVTIGSTDKKNIVVFKTGRIEQEVQWVPGIVEDFPGDQFYRMNEQLWFSCDDFGRRLRLARNSATTNPKERNTLGAGLFFHTEDGKIVMESAYHTRGVSRYMWTPSDMREAEPISFVLPYEAVEVLVRSANGFKGQIVVAADSGQNMTAWTFGSITYICRLLGNTFYNISPMYAGDGLAEASVPVEDFINAIGLICANTKSEYTPKATILMQSDGTVAVSSSTTSGRSEATMTGLCSGELPYTFTMNARQVLEILQDIKNAGIIHLIARVTEGRVGADNRRVISPTLIIRSPEDPDYIHIAILINTIQERSYEVAADEE